MSTPAVTAPAEVTTAVDTMPATTTVTTALVDPSNNRRSPPEKFTGNARHASMPQIDSRPRRLQETTMTAAARSAKEQTALQQRQQHGRSNSATASTASDRGVHRVFGGGSVGGANGGGGGGVGAGFKSKLRNSFRSTAKRIRQQQSAIDALAKNSQMLGLHNLQDSPRTMQVQRAFGREIPGQTSKHRPQNQPGVVLYSSSGSDHSLGRERSPTISSYPKGSPSLWTGTCSPLGGSQFSLATQNTCCCQHVVNNCKMMIENNNNMWQQNSFKHNRGNNGGPKNSNGEPYEDSDGLTWRRLHMSRAKLKATATTSELLSGFAMVAMVELQINEPTMVPEWLFIMFAVCTTVLVAVHIFALMISTYLLPNVDAISKLQSTKMIQESPHERMRGFVELAWAFSTVLGLFLFLVEVAILCWVKFWDHSFRAAMAATIIVIPVLVIFVFFVFHFYRNLVVYKCESTKSDIKELEAMKKKLDVAGTTKVV
ncbi:calcium release-activated calcium channel protein 1-like isoform X1 [Myzus persicae]|uniref:calcium release-activated calcium channel protein 1-like isoform X1 n=1 Tax=Myzus persicae TaxID=13164 RepID=UPI000B93391E|nr:calcium release-activated calcium channel protein 1-like isoform X1 [Myzus persicae]XP_022175032.1 calcium release-activated calcium channel protein 1-like isoform X1 [Myzus persicae]XP_022175033.1 calcium release-activated calcium channel protein 1-like isoform X1 [Myzus persicae]XP_022175034.1 calcium release-activated calcium channel protein 1-like isoform X1 [Myzus persicae]